MGSYTNVNGLVQRYQCLLCGKNLSDKTGNMNRLKTQTFNQAFRLLKAGASTRQVAMKIGISKITANKIQRRIFKQGVRIRVTPELSENKKAYLKKYFKKIRGRNQWARLKWNVSVREYAGWILMKAAAPMTMDELFPLVQKRFKRIKKCALAYMVNRNVDGWFLKHGDKWSYHPVWPFYRGVNDFMAGKSNLLMRTRKAWFKKNNAQDEWLEQLKKLKKDNATAKEIVERLSIFANTHKAFGLFNAASTLADFAKEQIAA